MAYTKYYFKANNMFVTVKQLDNTTIWYVQKLSQVPVRKEIKKHQDIERLIDKICERMWEYIPNENIEIRKVNIL